MYFQHDSKAIKSILNTKGKRERYVSNLSLLHHESGCNGNSSTSWILLNNLEDLNFSEVITRSYLGNFSDDLQYFSDDLQYVYSVLKTP